MPISSQIDRTCTAQQAQQAQHGTSGIGMRQCSMCSTGSSELEAAVVMLAGLHVHAHVHMLLLLCLPLPPA
jgi:hypothetical protein